MLTSHQGDVTLSVLGPHTRRSLVPRGKGAPLSPRVQMQRNQVQRRVSCSWSQTQDACCPVDGCLPQLTSSEIWVQCRCWFCRSGWNLRICTSGELPGGAGPRTTLGAART